jgi:Ethylbenzene dehydrogenase/Prokaryotic cytochrome b561
MGRRRSIKTDFGTIILHWVLVGLLVVSVLTGLRIATVSPLDFAWLQWLDALLPSTIVWTAHIPAALVLFGLALAYPIYIRRAGLTRRITPDAVRMRGIFRRGQPRWSAISIILTWMMLLTLLLLIATGCLMYLGHGGAVVTAHRFGTWLLLASAAGHIASHLAIGGVNQLLRMFRPSRLPTVAPPLDPFDLLVTQEQSSAHHHHRQQQERRPADAQQQPRRQAEPARSSRKDTMLQAHPLAVALSVGLLGSFLLPVVDSAMMRDELRIRKIAASEAPTLDGDLSDPVWRSARPVVVLTNQGANFDGKGTSEVEIRAVHDGETAYFSFVWSDPTRSLKHLPLIKKADGWHVMQGKYDVGDEHEYHEDKFSVLLTNSDALLAGDRTFHAGRAPAENKPATLSGRGLHYTHGDIADVWQWKATRGGLQGFVDDGYFGPPAEPNPDEIAGRAPYKGGFAADPGTANYADNFAQRGPGGYERSVQPTRLPKDWSSTWSAMGQIDLRSEIGESDGARWWMTEAESEPYSAGRDALYSLNAVIPGVIVTGAFTGDRADVRGAARWAAGRWALEISRRLDTKSRYDIAIVSGVHMRVAAFDRSQIRHTRHIRPIRIEVE